MRFTVGHTIKTTPDFPNGVPCILVDRDSVYCTFPTMPENVALVRADIVAMLLNTSGLGTR